MKVGDLVTFRGSVGIIVALSTARWAEKQDVWVQWTGELKPALENGQFLEVLSEGR